ncbi:hypothetical protein QR680_007762 [Steinernema hermaphroditum]|uniref:PAP-associated domain-containing protein n=1 Tax=Steinernema hermaphroditum TaxID=289476 RepID=A0AA39IE63_9BILA|nr:hypothetical protein QR680_007762 [Steinernema hermaphroditum]
MPSADLRDLPIKQRALKALTVLGPRLKLAVQEANLGTDIENELRISAPFENKDRFNSKDQLLYAVLSSVPVLGCYQIEVHFELAESLGNQRFRDASLFDKVNKRTLMDLLKFLLDNLKTAVKRLLTSEATNSLLRSHKIVPLVEISKRFPKAILYCEMCDFHASSLKMAISHKGGAEHICHEKLLRFRHRLKIFPRPSVQHSNAVLKVFDTVLADTTDYEEQIKQLTANLEELLRRQYAECQILLYGSHLTRLCHSASNINLSVIISDIAKTYILFTYLMEKLHELDNVENPVLLADRHTPALQFTFKIQENVKVTVHLTVNDRQSILYDTLIATYSLLNPNFVTLLKVVRYWAQVTHLTNQSWKALHKHGLDLMLVHFLQCRSFLPVLHEIDLAKRITTPMDEWDPSLPLYQNNPKVLKLWKNGDKKKAEWNVGELFINFLRYYACEFDEQHAVQITQNATVLRADLDWGRKFIVMKDPCRDKNVFHMAKDVYVYLCNVFVDSFVYFGVARFADGTAAFNVNIETFAETRRSRKKDAQDAVNSNSESGAVPGNSTENGAVNGEVVMQKELHDPENRIYSRTYMRSLREQTETPFNKILSELDILNDPERQKVWKAKKQLQENLSVGAYEFIFQLYTSIQIVENDSCKPSASGKRTDAFDFKFALEVKNLVHKMPYFICPVCNEEGHVEQVCTKWRVENATVYDELDSVRSKSLSDVIDRTHCQTKLTRRELVEYAYIKEELQKTIQDVYPSAVLTEFGSVASGFGNRECDFDLCLRFENENKLPQDLNITALIRKISELLTAPKFINVEMVSNAKVPIVKFKSAAIGIEGDISVYNSLALANTDLLRTYCSYDKRVAPLGNAIKKWAKVCGINDPAHGSLSSYALIIMMLHYLQRTSPPVLPILQDDVYTSEEKEMMIDGYDTKFCRYPELLGSSAYRNTSSVADLFIGFFDYFILNFDWGTSVVQIRRRSPMLKLEKNWYDRPFCIEDPFKLPHNLSTVVGRKMAKYILETIDLTRKSLRLCNIKEDATLTDNNAELLQACRLFDDPPSNRSDTKKRPPKNKGNGSFTPNAKESKRSDSNRKVETPKSQSKKPQASKAERNRTKKLARAAEKSSK